MEYLIFFREGPERRRNATSNLGKYRLCVWKPSKIRLYPYGIKGIMRKLDFISVWVLYYLFKPSVRDRYSAFLLYNEGEIIHQSVVTGKSFKYPFMKEDDLQIGMIFTERGYRRKGLAAYVLREMLNQYEKPGRTTWYITGKENIASRRLAESLGFSEFSEAIRRNIFVFGKYEVIDESEKLREEVPDYSAITEAPGQKATKEQLARLYQRYHFARQFAEGKDVLEIGCGAGLGLGYLGRVANRVVGGDIEEKNVNLASAYYKNEPNITIELMDAHNISFPDKSFDLILLYETIYYLKDLEQCIREAARVLREGGIFVVCTVNKDWEDFHPSPYTYRYFSASELYDLIRDKFEQVRLYGGFPTEHRGPGGEILSLIKRSAVRLDLIPGSLKRRTYLKRIFMGKLVPLPHEITEDMADYEPPVEIPIDRVVKEYKILYAIGKKAP